MEEKTKHLIQVACKIMHDQAVDICTKSPDIELLAGDGSQREFYRLRFEGGLRVIVIVPSEKQKHGMAEALSSWAIGNHLFHKGVPVPELIAFDRPTGLIVCEDLGDVRLYEYAKEARSDMGDLFSVYQPIIRELVRMQVLGHDGFDISWCWQTGHYDHQLMLERESGYFLEALCEDFFGLETERDSLVLEFENIAHQAAQAPDHFFLHRDFQSRNIMLKDGQIRFIDYQGGRLGPLGYDLASLLLDPYVGLPDSVQESLVDEYGKELNKHIPYDFGQFRQEYIYLSLQRNLQMLGAFAFLSKQRNKVFFRPFIPLALNSLQRLLAKPVLQKYSVLKHLTEQCLEKAHQYDF